MLNILVLENMKKTIEMMSKYHQIEISPFWSRESLINYHQQNNIITVAHSSLTKAKKLDDLQLLQMSEKYNCQPTNILINWALQQGFYVLPRTSNVKHLKENQLIVPIETKDLKIMKLWNCNFATHPQYL